jgi:transcriptional regulator with XRE-family HTH domain
VRQNGNSAKVGSVIAALRKAAGLTQADLAKRAAVSAVYVSQLESSQRIPSAETLRGLAIALETDWRPLGRQALIEADPGSEVLFAEPTPCLWCAGYKARLQSIAVILGFAMPRPRVG